MSELTFVEVVTWKIVGMSKYLYVKCSDIVDVCKKYALPTKKPLPKVAHVVDEVAKTATAEGAAKKDGVDGWFQFVDYNWYLEKFGKKWCNQCDEVKIISKFNKDRLHCRECGKEKQQEAAGDLWETDAPKGRLECVADLTSNTWTMYDGAKEMPTNKYVMMSKLSPAFPLPTEVDTVKKACTKATVLDEAARTAKRSTSKDGKAFFTLAWCLALLGMKVCNKCPENANIHPLADFAKTRTECRRCRGEYTHEKDAVNRAQNAAGAAQGETRTCNVCGENKTVDSFEGTRSTCKKCRRASAKDNGTLKAESDPENHRFCNGCQIAHPISDFDGDNKTCRKKLERNKLFDRVRNRTPKRQQWKQDWYIENKKNVDTYIKDRQYRAAIKGRAWSLTNDEAIKIITSPCFYSGIHEPMVHVTGMDRLNSKEGYTSKNTVPCNGFVNMMKKDLGPEAFVAMCDLEVATSAQRQMLLNRYNKCLSNNMKCPLGFEELCAAIVAHCDMSKLP